MPIAEPFDARRAALARARVLRHRAPAVVALCLLFGCGDTHDEPTPTPMHAPEIPETETAATAGAPAAVELSLSPLADPSIDALETLSGPEDWRRLAAVSDEHAIARVEVVKVVLELEGDRLHFCQSERWPLHYEYVLHIHPEERERYATLRAFSTRNYLRPDRRYLLGSIVHFVDGDHWALELGPADTMAAAEIATLQRRVADASFFGSALRFHPRSAHQIAEAAASSELSASILDTDALWADVTYQPVTRGRAIGRVVLAGPSFDPASLAGDEILVLAAPPDDLPPVAAVVTAQLQTPLSHVAVLSESRGTPNMALRGVLDDPAWRAFEGRWAELIVEDRSYHLLPASPPAASAPVARSIPEALEGACAPIALSEIGLDDVGRVGVKAAQLGEVARLGLPTPGGVVLPSACYLAHLRRHGIALGALASGVGRGDALEAERARIAGGEIDPALLDDLEAAARAMGTARVILRSSTNAEDLPGFSGAGLYESVACDARDRSALSAALSRVWASVRTLRAYDERARAGVPHDRVAMAVLVQPMLDDVRAMGVAITENPYSDHRPGHLVDLSPRGGSVTATGSDAPEEWILYLHSAPELVRSAPGARLVSPRDAIALRDLLSTLDAGLRPRIATRSGVAVRALDVELAIQPDGSIVVLQARPYGRAP